MRSVGGRRVVVAAVLVLVTGACGPGGSSAYPAGSVASGPPGATSFVEYAASACAALQSVWSAYGNPDTAQMSPMYRAFDESVKAGDLTTATAQAGQIRTELERGRAAAGVAAGWAPGLASMVQVDRFLLAMEAMVAAKLAATTLGHLEATNRGQAAFEAAGGIDAWYGMLGGIDAAAKAAGRPWPACEGVPIG